MTCYKCSVCTKTGTELEEHINAIHWIQCHMYKKRCADIAEFIIHFKKNHIFSCPSCEKEFGTDDEIKKPTECPCTICGL